jgi:VIT1/CCC1 family predicted Fe2+/Mn2+ transporter/rubrerythrin
VSAKPATASDVARWRRNLQGEVDGTHIYRAMAANAGDPGLATVYREMAESEERHAAVWREQLEAASLRARPSPSWRARVLALVARRAGAGMVAPTVARSERESRTMYDHQPEAAGTTLPEDERSHARTLHRITGGLSGAMLTRFEGRHGVLDGNALRAAVLGANDGLVSNFSLVMGVAGASSAGAPVVIAGVAGLLAGSLSMALGEWLSVQSSRELYANQIAVEAEELAAFPEEEEEELRLIYEAKGMDPSDARRLAHRVLSGDRAVALDTMAREELGIDPGDLGGSAWTAAATSFFLFAIGAAIPLVPFIVTAQASAIALSAALSAAALFGLGAAITLMTGRHPVWAGMRQLVFGLAAAAVTYTIGWLLGTTVL